MKNTKGNSVILPRNFISSEDQFICRSDIVDPTDGRRPRCLLHVLGAGLRDL